MTRSNLNRSRHQNAAQVVGFSPVDGQVVLPAHGNDGSGEPTAVVLRQPLGRVVVSLPVPVQVRGGERQVVQVGREAPAHGGTGGAQPGIVRLGYGDDVLDVGLAETLENLEPS